MPISDLMKAELEMEMAMTRRLLTRIPQEKWDWKPNENLHSIGWNANHLAEILGWVPGILNGSEWDFAPVGGEAYTSPTLSSPGPLLESFDQQAKVALDALTGVADPVMEESWSLKMGGQTLFTMKKGDCLRKWVFSHSAHHRGILSVYLRMIGVSFPSIYEE